MTYQILKQYLPGYDSVWVGAIGEEDQIETFNTIEEAETRLAELQELNPDRKFKIVEKQEDFTE